jgi:protein-tyrosine phosphatase
MIKVLFVCLGNICRSPMAEGVFRSLVDDAGLSADIMIDSAGTGSWHAGETAHRGTLDVLQRKGIDYDGRARQFRRRDMHDFDYVLAMDASNLSKITPHMPDDSTVDVRLFLDYANQAGLTDVREVPDPYYDGKFDTVYDLVTKGSRALLDHIRETHDL